MNENDEINELEWRLQQATADYLKGEIYKGLKVIGTVPIPFHHLKYHHPALEYRGAAEGAKYKRRGSTSGIPDWLLWGPNRFHGMIELKVAGRGLNHSQNEVKRWADEYGFPHAVARSVAQFRNIIIAWGFPCHNMGCREPDHHTQEQKRAAVFDWYKPAPQDMLAQENLARQVDDGHEPC